MLLASLTRVLSVAAIISALLLGARAQDASFENWLSTLRSDATRLGVSRATFDAATRDLEPDLSLPDLVIPGRPGAPPRGQAEFIQAPADYLSKKSLTRLTEQGRRLADEHRSTLAAIEQQFGVPAEIVLAIWGRETAFGGYRLPHNAIRVLATQAYLGRRKDQFRQEFLLALRMLEEGHVTLGGMRSSWAGAMGLTQFLPTDFYKNAIDFDGDGRRDIWTSIPDALASAAKQLTDKGWERGRRWAHEVRVPRGLDCTRADPERQRPIADWLREGFEPAHGRKLRPEELAEPASLLLPAGTYGPAFLTPKNYFVIKEYNFSDLYVLFVGTLADRIAGRPPFEVPWHKVTQLQTSQVEAMQRRMAELGLYTDKIDGKAGMKTRLALGAYQKAQGLPLDCWPTQSLLSHMQAR